MAAPAVALVVGAGLVLSGGGDDPAYALTELSSGSIRVEVFPAFDDVGSLQGALERAGLDAMVIHIRAHPSLDGVVEVASLPNNGAGALEFDRGEFVIDPVAFDGEIEILIYSQADKGSDYQVAPSIFAPAEPLGGLSCAYADSVLATQELERLALDAGITSIIWTLLGEIDTDSGSVDFDESELRPDGSVIGAQMRNSETLAVSVSPTQTRPAAEIISLTDGTHYKPAPTCTPELAAPWE